MNNTKILLPRVAEITLIFWVIKTLSTTVGETGADYLAVDLGMGMPLVTIIMSTIMTILLFLQFKKYKRYIPAIYWTIVVLMSIIGTLITDIIVDDYGVSLVTLSVVFSITMLLGFTIWYKNEKTLSIHDINTGKREAYYWLIILLTFALGTGVGDLISERIGLGYGVALALFAGIIALVAFSHIVLKMNATLSFWLAFIMTRPLGASLGDLLTQPSAEGGFGISMMPINALFFIVITGLVIHLNTKLKNSDLYICDGIKS